jgi:hypothetical protein
VRVCFIHARACTPSSPERKREREKEIEKEAGRERERKREREYLFLKGMMGALAPCSYLVFNNHLTQLCKISPALNLV